MSTQSAPQHIARSTRLLAFYLTQYHPIPENDEWWGKGFTEWTNTTAARPLFPGHYQPHLPTDLGFYDLRVRQTRHEQIALARQYGIDGFCYHYYWFSGRRVLEQPLNDMLADAESDMPFCICWANENWSRRWDAAEHEILLAQQYRADDDLCFITELEPVLKDRRYIHVDGAPLLIVYRPQQLPDPQTSARIWRDYCRSVGIPRLHLCAAFTHGNWDYAQFGFDSGVEFPPHNVDVGLDRETIRFNDRFNGTIIDYPDIAGRYLQREYSADYRGFRTVFPSWDNTARRGERAMAVINGTPQNYEYWLDQAIVKTEQERPDQDRLVFINAWNEWAEGCHLEPDRRYGRLFLEATFRAKRRATTLTGFTHAGVPVEAQLIRRRQRFGSPGKRLGKWLQSISWLDPVRQYRLLQAEHQRLIAELDRQRIANIHLRDGEARLLAEIDRLQLESQQVHEEASSQSVPLVRKVTR